MTWRDQSLAFVIWGFPLLLGPVYRDLTVHIFLKLQVCRGVNPYVTYRKGDGRLEVQTDGHITYIDERTHLKARRGAEQRMRNRKDKKEKIKHDVDSRRKILHVFFFFLFFPCQNWKCTWVVEKKRRVEWRKKEWSGGRRYTVGRFETSDTFPQALE